MFSSKLRDHQVEVNPAVWNSIAKEIGGASAPTGMSLVAKVGIGLFAGVVITSLVIYGLNTNNSTSQDKIDTPIIIEKQVISQEDNTPIDSINYSPKTQVVTPVADEDHKVVDREENQIVESEEWIQEPETIELSEDIIVEEPTKEERLNEEENINSPLEEAIVQEEEFTPEETFETSTETTSKEEPQATYSIERLPNIFSPNNDGKHDQFFIHSEGLYDFTLVVLDQNNKKVFQTSDPAFVWTGLDMQGNLVPTGNYIYFLTARDAKGIAVNKYNTLTISR